MPKAFIDPNKCLKCEKCPAAEACLVKAIFKVDLDNPAIVEQSACFACGDCVEKCPGKAIAIKPT